MEETTESVKLHALTDVASWWGGVNGVTIRLPAERWIHITEEHGEMSGYMYDVLECVKNPDAIYKGRKGELIATMKVNGRILIVVYKEVSKKDGFVITSFISGRRKWLEKRAKLWERAR